MKSIVLLLAIIGIILVAVGYVKSNLQCPPPRIEYRYIPKTFDDEQSVHTPVMSMAGMNSMFEDDSAWIQNTGFKSSDTKNKM
jgi:hypothetical protein